MSAKCLQLHKLIQKLPEERWPFHLDRLPRNGIYFFFEKGETWGHGGAQPRIVRVGTHREGNFRSRIADHYVLDDRKMFFNQHQPAPKDRSIFRKNIGRALLLRDQDPYLSVWNIDFTTPASRERDGFRRDVEKEKQVEGQVTRILHEQFSFRWLELNGEKHRMGSQGLEAAFIGTLANCCECHPSSHWLGRSSPKPKITHSGLWQEQYLTSLEITERSLAEVAALLDAH